MSYGQLYTCVLVGVAQFEGGKGETRTGVGLSFPIDPPPRPDDLEHNDNFTDFFITIPAAKALIHDLQSAIDDAVAMASEGASTGRMAQEIIDILGEDNVASMEITNPSIEEFIGDPCDMTIPTRPVISWRKATANDVGRLARFADNGEFEARYYGMLVEVVEVNGSTTFYCKSDNEADEEPFWFCEVQE